MDPFSLPPFVSRLAPDDPRAIGHYRLIGRLGGGGMGTVYAAVSERRARVALKVAHPGHGLLRDFERELSLMRRVDGVCGVGVYDGGLLDGRPWAAMEYVPGLSLGRHVREHGAFREPHSLIALAAGCAEALTAIHAAGVAHGDLKPGNVVMAPDGPKVIDYGIARLLDEPATGRLAGSPGWLAPERYRGEHPGTSSDVFAWGCLVAYAASGRPPFGHAPRQAAEAGDGGRESLAEMAQRTREQSVDLSALPGGLAAVVGRALSRDPSLRPSAEECYLECLALLGEDRRSDAAARPAHLRELLSRHWPRIDVSWDAPSLWTAAAGLDPASGHALFQAGPPGPGGPPPASAGISPPGPGPGAQQAAVHSAPSGGLGALTGVALFLGGAVSAVAVMGVVAVATHDGPAIPEHVAGTWSGEVTQTDMGAPFSLTVTLAEGTGSGTMVVPDSLCVGEMELLTSDDDHFVFDLVFNDGSICRDGEVLLTYESTQTLHYSWGDPDATSEGVLSPN